MINRKQDSCIAIAQRDWAFRSDLAWGVRSAAMWRGANRRSSAV